MTTNTGGPAFPGLHPSKECHYQDAGMTLRDYFAAHASEEDIKYWQPMSMRVQRVREVNGRKSVYEECGMYSRETARYRYADAMLRAGILV